MMGPWLIFASLMNRAAMGLYYGAPTSRGVWPVCAGREGDDAGRGAESGEGVAEHGLHGWLDWSAIKVFSSTGECSNAADMQWLMEQGGGKPVIEYCGGTEIGGAYLTSTLTLPCAPGEFNTPTLGLDVVILDEAWPARRTRASYSSFRHPSDSPLRCSMGIITKSILQARRRVRNGEVLRRHGDQMERLPGGGWRARGPRG